MITFIDPNWPINDGEIDFPISVMRGWELCIGDKWVTCQRTMMINDPAEFLKLFEEWDVE